jgi:hypothetical protein
VCVVTQEQVEYCALNGTASWQESVPCSPDCLLLNRQDAVITENDGSDNIAISSYGGDTVYFYWSDSSGTFHQEVVATGIT